MTTGRGMEGLPGSKTQVVISFIGKKPMGKQRVMGLAYATQNATGDELKLFQALLSIYRDGSGAEREKDGSTRANWRQIERCVADLLNSTTSEDKNIFDVIAKDQSNSRVSYGYSVKSKQLSAKAFSSLSSGGRVYMEIANSPALFWDEIRHRHNLTESAFRAKTNPQQIGDTLVATVTKWHKAGKRDFESANPGCRLELSISNYFCLSYSENENPNNREYQVHIFPLEYPNNIVWQYSSDKCLRGFDPNHATEPLLDWYGLSGGQLKYYPKTTYARYKSPVFKLLAPPQKSAREKVEIYFPHHLS